VRQPLLLLMMSMQEIPENKLITYKNKL
jgi:hypothetical protein